MLAQGQSVLEESLAAKLDGRRAKLGIIGLGYVGVPLGLTAAKAGFEVVGFDINETRVERINRAEAVIQHISAERMREALRRGFRATSDLDQLQQTDVIIICVPTPLTPHREPDLSFVVGTMRSVASRLRRGQLVILESTTYPGTTDEIVRPILEATGMKSGVDFFLAFSPEREDPGNKEFSTSDIPKVVGGDGDAALALAQKVYAQLVAQTIPVSSPATAEAVKLTENIFRAVNIALVNELKVVFSAMGIDVWEVIDAAKTKPFGYMPFYPGPGLGGHCIPIDPFYLTWKAREYDVTTRFIELAGEINVRMPYFVVEKLGEALNRELRKAFSGTRILLLGAAYKKNVDDMRESPSLKLIELIENRGAHCDYHDPFVSEIPPTREHSRLAGRRSVSLSRVAEYDAVLIATDHDCVDYPRLVSEAKLVLDTRNVCERFGLRGANIFKA